MPAAFDIPANFSGITNLLRAAKRFCVGDPPPPRETKDAQVLRLWQDYWGLHVAIDKGKKDGIRYNDIFFVVHPKEKIEVTNPESGAVLTTYYRNTFKVGAAHVHNDWTECNAWEDNTPALSVLPDSGNLAVYQYNYDDWAENPRKVKTVVRFP